MFVKYVYSVNTFICVCCICFNVVTNLKPYVLSLLYNILWEISSFGRIFGGSVNIVTISGNM